MELRKIGFGNFKSLYQTSFEPGKVNVFIGANGSGKSTVLEAIGLLSAAMTDRVDDASLQRKGVRLSVPELYKSRFEAIKRTKLTIDLSAEWTEKGINDVFEYNVHLTPPMKTEYWKYHSETLLENGQQKWGRSNASRRQIDNNIGFFLLDNQSKLKDARMIAKQFKNYGIYQPNTMSLRGNVSDPNQMVPIGLNGGRLADALQDIIREEDDDIYVGSLLLEDILELIDWASDITISTPKKTNINAGIPTMRQVIEFGDRFMKDTVRFTGYEASEGALYVLFMLCLAMHPQAPAIFAIDSFDHALNPRLARKVMELFAELIIKNQKHVFLTTHNPLVLDGLDLQNDDIRLFAVDRDKHGYAQINRIQISEKLIKEGQPLSRLWMGGRLGGVPELL